MTNNLQKKLFEDGYLIIKNVLNFRRDLKPVLDDMDFVMDCLIQKYAKKKDVKKVLNLDFRAVKNKFFEPSLTGITFFAFEIIISKPAFSAASASSALLLIATAAAVTIFVAPGPTDDVATKICCLLYNVQF